VPGLQGPDDAQLLGGVHAGVHPHLLHEGGKGGLGQRGQLRAGQHQVLGRGDDAQLLGNGLGGERVVAGNHDGDDAGRLAFGHGLPDFGTGRINQAGKTEKGQARFHRGGRHVGGQGGQHLGRVGQHPVALRGQGIDALPQFGHTGLLAGVELLEQGPGGPFGQAQHPGPGPVQGAHALALRIKGQLGQARKLRFQRGTGVVLRGRVLSQRHFGGIAQPVAGGIGGGIGVEGHGG